MNNLYTKTNLAAQELKDSFKCLACQVIPSEPYFTGVCDHLLCRNCIEKSNLCPVCQASFYQKECHLNKMIKEAIGYVNKIIHLTENIDIADESNPEDGPINESLHLSSIHLNSDSQSSKKDSVFKEPIAPQKKTPQSQSASRLSRRSSISKERLNESQNTPTTKKKKNQNQDPITTQLIDQTQTGTQKSRAVSAKRTKKNDKGEAPLHIAVMDGDLIKIKEILKESSDINETVNIRDLAGWTPLHEACNQGNLEIVRLLIENNADMNALGYQNNTPLHEAALNTKYDCCKYLLEMGANKSIRNQFGVLASDFVKNSPEFVKLFNSFENEEAILNEEEHLDHSVLNTSKTSTQKKILFGTGMNEEGKNKLKSLAEKLKLNVAKEMSNSVTHIIFDSQDKTCNRTMNYMKGVLMGIWIVSIEWLEESLKKGYLLNENSYEASGSHKNPKAGGPFNGRLNAARQYPKLFEDCKFYFHGEFNVFPKEELIKLIQIAGGTILKREPKVERADELKSEELPHHIDPKCPFKCSNFILYEMTKVKEIKHEYLRTVKPSWVFNCIDYFKIIYPE